MPAERFYLKGSYLEGEQVSLEGQEFHHLVHVMRAKVGDTVELVNGSGLLAVALVKFFDKKQASLQIQKTKKEAQGQFKVILAQAIPRLNRLDFILEKGTELGMTDLWLFPGKQSERKNLSENQVERLKIVMIAAMKQCGRLFLPEIHLMPPLEKWPKPSYNIFFGDIDSKAPLFLKSLEERQPKEGAIIVIGPESGFNEQETQLFRKWNAAGVRLNQHILRTDTAAIAGLNLLNYWLLTKNDI